MPDALFGAYPAETLVWLLAAVCCAGLVRGFSGFGSAMIIMPVASSVLPPVEALAFMTAAELFGPLPNLRAAVRQGDARDVALLLLGVIVALPFGLWGLSQVSASAFGWTVSGAVLGLLALIVTGWRFRGALTPRLTVATGALGGLSTGLVGLAGPPVIMLYMASKLPIAVIRANFLMYLLAIDVLLFFMMWYAGLLVWSAFALGLVYAVPNILANFIGGRLFDPGAERVFRTVAYVIIGISALVGLPFWKG